jgi:ribosomal protein L32
MMATFYPSADQFELFDSSQELGPDSYSSSLPVRNSYPRKSARGSIKPLVTPYRTCPDSEFDRRVRTTAPGMAHFAGTGPQGTTCDGCAHLTLRHRVCRQYERISGRHGTPLPPAQESCRYFTVREA